MFFRLIAQLADFTCIAVAFTLHMRVDACACITAIETSNSKHSRRQSLRNERRIVSHCHTNWWALVFNNSIITIVVVDYDKAALRLFTVSLQNQAMCWHKFERRNFWPSGWGTGQNIWLVTRELFRWLRATRLAPRGFRSPCLPLVRPENYDKYHLWSLM